MGGDRGAHPVTRVDQDVAEALEAGVAVALVAPHRRRPAALGGDHPLVVPIGALDQPDRGRHLAVAQGRGGKDPLQGLLGVAKVGLDHHAD